MLPILCAGLLNWPLCAQTAPQLQNPRLQGTNYLFEILATPSALIDVEFATGLVNPEWTRIRTITGQVAAVTVTEMIRGSTGFYRLRSNDNPPSVRGLIRFTNTPPAEIAIPMDDNCAASWGSEIPTTHYYRVGLSQGLADVVVHITNLVAGVYPIPAPPVTMDCLKCLYDPQIAVARTGQTVRVVNRDPFINAVHTMPTIVGNLEQNFALPPGASRDFSFPKPEMFIKFKDDIHPWKFAWVSTFSHPFFALTDTDGNFSLPAGLPPGSYTLEAYHRKAGRKSTTFTYDGVNPVIVDFEFGAP